MNWLRAALSGAALLLFAVYGAPASKPRLIVLTDIGGDPDDQQSMIRLMVYSNEFEIEGLIASASGTPGELKENKVRPDLIREIVQAYGEARPNLVKHAAGYPDADRLLRVVKSGNPVRGVDAGVGAGRDTEGSEWIITVVDRPDPRPVCVSIWGGSTELAQALWKVRATRSASEADRFVSKLRVYATGNQDDTGPWIVANFPKLFYVLGAIDPEHVSGRPQRPGVDQRSSVYRGVYLTGDISTTSREWIEAHVKNGHGPLGALYPMKTWTAPNPHSTMKEGDTPSWFYFLPLGWTDPEHPEWGGWGGRFRLLRNRVWNDAPEGREAVARWRPEFQADFAARMNWAVAASRGAANHAPVAKLTGSSAARAGSTVRLSAKGSSDPDKGQALTYEWSVYVDASTCPMGVARITLPSAAETALEIGPAASECELHVLLKATDNGTPALSSRRRLVVHVRP